MIAMIGTSDRLCWLAETCKILLLLLLVLFMNFLSAPQDIKYIESSLALLVRLD